jgi:hypothetical protein
VALALRRRDAPSCEQPGRCNPHRRREEGRGDETRKVPCCIDKSHFRSFSVNTSLDARELGWRLKCRNESSGLN